MRCPHCTGEIPPGSHFCGICGGHVIEGGQKAPPQSLPPNDTGSLFDLPQSGRARRSRIALVLAFDLILAGAGIAMIWSYLNSRSEAASKKTATASASVDEVTPEKSNAEVGKTKIAPANASGGSGAAALKPDQPAPDTPTPDRPTADKPKPDKPKSDKPKPDKPKPDKPKPGGGAGSGTGANGGSGTGAGSGTGSETGAGNSGGGVDAGPGEIDEEAEAGVFASRIEGTVRRNQGALTRCYSQAAKTHSAEDPLEGRVVIRFRISPNEKVERVRAVKNTTGSSVLESCLVSHVRSWRFPDGPSKPLDFEWPFRFRPK